MSLARVHSRGLEGLEAPEVVVEVHLAPGLPAFTLVGLAETAVREARERVRAALLHSGLGFPSNRRIVVSLAPADLPKDGGRFDLPIALGLLAAAGQIDPAGLEGLECAGELSLAGALRPVRGALALALGWRRAGSGRRLVLPRASAEEAARVPGVAPLAADHLLDLVRACLPGDARVPLAPARAAPPAPPPAVPDLREVRGQAEAKRALEVAAAGGHSLLLVGPPGSGKSMLAQRLPSLLPPLEPEAALASAALLELAGAFDPGHFGRRPFRAPHHSASAAALVGGGSPPRPGEISLAHEGILFLDEVPEFPRLALEALREPLETGRIALARAQRRAEFPARFQLVAAMNPCPCGLLGHPRRACRCSPEQVARYQGRLSGPWLDRLDLQVEVGALPADALQAAPSGASSAEVAARVAAARVRQQDRQGRLNHGLDGEALDRWGQAEPAAEALLRAAAEHLGWSARGHARARRVARSIADLAGHGRVEAADMAEAIQLRRARIGG